MSFRLRVSIAISLLFLFLHPIAYACSSDYNIWQLRDKTADPYYRFVRDGMAGYIDRNGKVVVAPTKAIFLGGNSGGAFHDGLLLTGVNDGAYLDSSGKTALTTGLDINWDFSEGLAWAMRSSEENLWGLIDRTGKFVVEPKFESYPNGYVYPFSDGLAMIAIKKKFGFIDRTARFVIQPSYIWAQGFIEDRARVIADGPCYRPMTGGCDMGEKLGDSIEGQKLIGCRFRFIDKTGSFVGSVGFDDAHDYSEGLAAVQRDGKWGFIDKSGNVIIPFRFGSVGDFSDGLARVAEGTMWEDKRWGYIDKIGKLVIPYSFERADDFSDGVAPVASKSYSESEKERYFYIGKNGQQAFSGLFREASPFFRGVGHVKLIPKAKGGDPDFYLNGRYAYINAKGKTIFVYERGGEGED